MIEWFVGLSLVGQLLIALVGISTVYALVVLLYLLVLSYVISGPIDIIGSRRQRSPRKGRDDHA